ncbi:hypothetical protein REH65_11565 [Saccharopolyspora sp. ID03-671]|uniref:hypothetical protein n=1 Tax=Saccharopolyspora sp. ID03-671 TaxID=3073066 RepID=UPI0032490D99
MDDLAGGSGGKRSMRVLLIGGAVVYLVTMGLLQYNFSRMHSQIDSVTSNLDRTNQQLSALGNLEMLRAEMSELDRNIVAMRDLMGPFPDMAQSVGALNGQIASLSRTIVMLQSDTAGLPSVAASIRQMSAELRSITARMDEMNHNVSGTSGNVADMEAQVGAMQRALGELQADVSDMDQRLKFLPKAPG